jgi:hypothetical protein
VVGLILAMVFQPAHCTDRVEVLGAATPAADEPFELRRLRTTADIRCSFPIVGGFVQYLGRPPEPSGAMSVYGEAWHPEQDDGTHAEVWSPSLGCWLRGFSVVGRHGDFLAIRRLSDASVLPVLFAESDVRLVGGG